MADDRSTLNLFDCVCIIVGVIIGSGIYRTTPLIAGSAGGAAATLGIWLLGGLIVLNGALCYSELVTCYPRRGGDYAFLNLAYGRWLGFLFAWTEFWIIRPANVGAMAFVYAEYARQLFGAEWSLVAHALSSVVLLTAVNLAGIRGGTRTQNALSVLKVAGLALLLLAALLATPADEAAAPEAGFSFSGIQLALILVLFTYGGWNDVSYVAAEVREPRRNLPRALLLGTSLVILIYLLVNLAFLRVLGYKGVAESTAVAADVMTASVGPWGAKAISLLICVSCLGAISAMIFTGSRIYHAMGVDHPIFGWLGRWSARGVPAQSVIAQGLTMSGMIVLLGRDQQGFERLAVFAAPFFWLFFSLVSAALFVLRDREPPKGGRPFSAPLYPVGPLLFVASCLFMFYSSTIYLAREHLLKDRVPVQGIWTAIVLGSGLLLWLLAGRRGRSGSTDGES